MASTDSDRPQLTLLDITGAIAAEQYLQPVGTLTLCILTMSNGCTVVGQSACLSPSNFDAEIGKKIARENAINQCWQLEGYALASLNRHRVFQALKYGTEDGYTNFNWPDAPNAGDGA